MRKCTSCKQGAADWAWQPFGPDETINTFATLGSHYRGFPALPICDTCKGTVETGRALHFTYKQTPYIAVKGAVNEAPF